MAILYLCMATRRWDKCQIEPGILAFGGSSTGSIGFLEVFDDLEKLKEQFPNAEYHTIETGG